MSALTEVARDLQPVAHGIKCSHVPWKATANTHQWKTPLAESSYCQFYVLSSLNLIIPLTGSWSQGTANFLDLQFNQIIAVDQSHRNKNFITSKNKNLHVCKQIWKQSNHHLNTNPLHRESCSIAFVLSLWLRRMSRNGDTEHRFP